MFLPGSGTADWREATHHNCSSWLVLGRKCNNAMPFIPVLDTVLAEIRMTQDFQKVENTLYFRAQDPFGTPEMEALAEALENWWISDLIPITNAGVALREIFITDLTTATSPTISRAPATLLTGFEASEALPNSVSCSVSMRTAQRGRSFRGRNYFVGLSDLHVGGNTLTEGFVTALTDAYNQIRVISSAVGFDHVVVSRFADNAPRVAGVATPVTSCNIVDTTVDSMRRRLPGRGA